VNNQIWTSSGAWRWASGGESGARHWVGAVRLGLDLYLPWVAQGQTGCWGLYHCVGSGEEMCVWIGYSLWREIMMW
jgi:hypothetical protein